MKVYFIDTNVFLRFLLQDVPEQVDFAKHFFAQAKEDRIKITVTPLVVMEILFTLSSSYPFSREEIVEKLGSLIRIPFLDFEEREVVQEALLLYLHKNKDFVDCFLQAKASFSGGEVLSFDKDFRKLRR